MSHNWPESGSVLLNATVSSLQFCSLFQIPKDEKISFSFKIIIELIGSISNQISQVILILLTFGIVP